MRITEETQQIPPYMVLHVDTLGLLVRNRLGNYQETLGWNLISIIPPCKYQPMLTLQILYLLLVGRPPFEK